MILIASSRKEAAPGRPRKAAKRTRAAAPSDAARAMVAAAAEAEKPPRILMLNVDPSMPDFIEQIDEVAPKGTSITLFCPDKPTDLPKMRHASLKHVSGDPSSAAELAKVNAHAFDAVICLQPGGGSDIDDSKLLVELLALQQAARAEGSDVPRVVGEVHSPSMLQLLAARGWPANKGDFVLPNELCSGILVQFALQPELRSIYSELLGSEGKEIVLHPASMYAAEGAGGGKGVTFEELSLGARDRGEVAIGVHLAGEEKPTINPGRDLRVKLKDGDKLVVLGDAF